MLVFFFFKQKTAYDMRISDWSSDVCSSDLKGIEGAVDDPPHESLAAFVRRLRHPLPRHGAAGKDDAARRQGLAAHLYDPTVRTVMLEGVGLRAGDHGIALFRQAARIAGPVFAAPREVVEEIREVAAYRQLAQIGRASWRERVCQYG